MALVVHIVIGREEPAIKNNYNIVIDKEEPVAKNNYNLVGVHSRAF
jgi:hypothetical protein